MNSLKKPILGFLLVVSGLLLAGCAATPQGSTIPWSRPADWENQIPGMSNSPGMGR